MGNSQSFNCDGCKKSCKNEEKLKLSCDHKCCATCVASIARRGVQTQDLKILKCPAKSSCMAPLTQAILQGVLSPLALREYERLVQLTLHQGTLQSKPHSCPKCKRGAEADPDRFLGSCSICKYIFCTKCKTDYHGFNCNDDQEEEILASDEFLERMRGILRLVRELAFPEGDEENGAGPSASHSFECNICLTMKSLTLSIDFGCGHITSCQECVKTYFTTLINSGSVHELKCPQSDCKREATPSLVKEIVEQALFLRYDQLLLNEALGDFPEIVNCPKPNCGQMVTAEPEYAHCLVCDYRFCTECNQPFHGLSGCGQTDAEQKAEIKRYLAADQEERVRIEKEAVGLRKKQNIESENLIKRLFKKCPSCKATIEKIMGCNHMQCSKCTKHFCWICGEDLKTDDPYIHFNMRGSKCGLFEVPPE